ncbi:MAG: YtxH domain-containing protein [Coriobacteriia bacterium]
MKRRVEAFALGVVLGVAGGYVLGLLFAPSSGSNARHKAAEKIRKAAEVARTVAVQAEGIAELLGDRVELLRGHDEDLARRKVLEIREGVQRYTQAQA